MLFLLATAAGTPAAGQDAVAVPAAPREAATTRPAASIDPEADAVLRAASRHLADSKSFTFAAEVWVDQVHPAGRKFQFQKAVRAGVRRPDRVYTESESTRVSRGLWYDGKTVTLYNKQTNHYGTVPAPASIDKTVEAVGEEFGISVPLSDLFVSDVYAAVTKHVLAGDYLGREKVGDRRCHHLAFAQEDIDWQVWVEDASRPVIRKVVMTYKNEEQSPQFTAVLSGWDFDARLPDFAFTFQPPLGASKIDVLPARTGGDGATPGAARTAAERRPADPPPPAGNAAAAAKDPSGKTPNDRKE